MLYSVKCLEKY